MQKPARVLSIIELCDLVFTLTQPADKTINEYLRKRRYIGSNDRRYITESIWEILRHYARFSIMGNPLNGRKTALMFLKLQNEENILDLFVEKEFCPAPLTSEELAFFEKIPENYPDAYLECPAWLRNEISSEENLVLLEQATADFRVNTLKVKQDKACKDLRTLGFEIQKTPNCPTGLRLLKRANLTQTDLFKKGWFEVQDEGSQRVTLFTKARPHEVVIDWCAGAGGKTLALSAMMKNYGTIYALDITPERMKELPSRATRAGAKNINILKTYDDIPMLADLVVVDAPCSGTGTWRRSPDARWRINKASIDQLIQTQVDILNKACVHVKSGGRLAYITCSLLKSENEDQITKFLSTHPDFYIKEDETPQRLSPLIDHTDGFFVAMMTKRLD